MTVFDQTDKQIKDLRLNSNEIRSAPQFMATDVERVVAKLEPQEPSRPALEMTGFLGE